MSIPLLIVGAGNQELSDRADEFGMFGSAFGLYPYLAETAQDALEVFEDEGPRLMMTILPPGSQNIYDQMRQAGYREKFLVYDHPSSKADWKGREVDFFKPKAVTADIVEDLVRKMLD